MKVRRSCLPSGWYPGTAEDIQDFVHAHAEDSHNARSVVVPHAGWFFSGRLAVRGISQLDRAARRVVVLGGHLPVRSRVLVWEEDQFASPVGTLGSDRTFVEALGSRIELEADRGAENSIEIHLPIVKTLFAGARIVALRVPPSTDAVALGHLLADLSKHDGIPTVCIGSADLSHYGPNYGVEDLGRAANALTRIEHRDRRFLSLLASLEWTGALDAARHDGSSCSAGAAVAAGAFSQSFGATQGKTLDYTSSYAVRASDSFVGYGVVSFSDP